MEITGKTKLIRSSRQHLPLPISKIQFCEKQWGEWQQSKRLPKSVDWMCLPL